jgi:dolichyl-phosphate beta-glucosyltransferase
MSGPDLSIVIPAYNEEARLPRTLAAIARWLEAGGPRAEIIVADDGSRDGTERVAREAGAMVLRRDENRGKGDAVRRGMLAARGPLRLMTDADLSTPIEDFALLKRRLDEGYDVAIGSRAMAGANVEVRQPAFRELSGRAFNLLVRLLLLPGLQDTQCGFKLFNAAAAEAAFSAARLDGFSFDVETLFVARRRGFRVAEVPVTWRNDAATHVGLAKGALAFADLVRIRANAMRGRYDGGL